MIPICRCGRERDNLIHKGTYNKEFKEFLDLLIIKNMYIYEEDTLVVTGETAEWKKRIKKAYAKGIHHPFGPMSNLEYLEYKYGIKQ